MNLSKFQGVATCTYLNNGALHGRYHNTDVAIAAPGGVISLNTGGYFTRTTKARMNQFSNHYCGGAFKVYQKGGQWFAQIRDNAPLKFQGNGLTFQI